MEQTVSGKPVQRADLSSLGWLVQAVSGLLLVVLLLLHMIANHFVAAGGLQSFQDVVRYLSNPLILVLETAFLVTVTSHALLGVRAVLFDLNLSAGAKRAVTALLTVLGVAMVGYGVWLTSIILRS
ncbi:MAG TPA: hypothetical protein VHS06_02640 [Chloroflexota bacterium]|nr:hypothetical protein [Chloroflexota bacterium]